MALSFRIADGAFHAKTQLSSVCVCVFQILQKQQEACEKTTKWNVRHHAKNKSYNAIKNTT